ncbi:MAG: hypothetical protein WC303_03045 [Candidatus Paceibacterota bacterium]|jgi:predicted RNA-binding Zn-ribbon protein involved in translation (DUF1610 family)
MERPTNYTERRHFDANHPFGETMKDFLCPECKEPMINTLMWGPTCHNCGHIETL